VVNTALHRLKFLITKEAVDYSSAFLGCNYYSRANALTIIIGGLL
jgi:hypothetical protein